MSRKKKKELTHHVFKSVIYKAYSPDAWNHNVNLISWILRFFDFYGEWIIGEKWTIKSAKILKVMSLDATYPIQRSSGLCMEFFLKSFEKLSFLIVWPVKLGPEFFRTWWFNKHSEAFCWRNKGYIAMDFTDNLTKWLYNIRTNEHLYL